MLRNRGLMLRNVMVFLAKRNVKLYGLYRGERVENVCKVCKVRINKKERERGEKMLLCVVRFALAVLRSFPDFLAFSLFPKKT